MDEAEAKVIARWIALQRYANGITRDAEKEIAKLFREIRKAIGDDAYRSVIDKAVSASGKELEKVLVDGFSAGAGTFLAAEAAAYGMKYKPVTDAQVSRALKKTLSAQNASTESIFQDMLRGVKTKTKAAISRGMNEGQTIVQVRNELSGIMDQTNRAIEAVVRTGMNAVANETRMEMYAANDDITDRWMWLSVLDHRTSDFCQAASGKIFKINKGPTIPAHVNCRSMAVPVMVDETDTAARLRYTPRPAVEPSSKNFKKGDELTRTGRKRKPRKDGPLQGIGNPNVPGGRPGTTATSYGTWLRRQPAEYQKAILGNKGYEEFSKTKGDSQAALIKVLRNRTDDLTKKQFYEMLLKNT